MTEDQKVAILSALLILNEADIPSALVKMYGSSENEMFISLPEIKTGENDDTTT